MRHFCPVPAGFPGCTHSPVRQPLAVVRAGGHHNPSQSGDATLVGLIGLNGAAIYAYVVPNAAVSDREKLTEPDSASS